MASLTKCLLCGAQLVNGREWDGDDHVCEADRTPEPSRRTCEACGGRGEIGGFEASGAPGYVTEECPDCGGTGSRGETMSEMIERQREARGEYLGELDEAREDEEP